MMPPALLQALNEEQARFGPFAGRVRWFEEITSTNDVALAAAEAGEDEGLVVLANRQTQGRGRLGRTWASVAGAGVYMSLLLRPSTAVMPLLTLTAGVAVADGIEAATGLSVALKWPNDACVRYGAGWKKLAGLLAEAGDTATRRPYTVIGIGINVTGAACPPDIQHRATSIETELQCPVDRGAVIVESLAAMAMRYAQVQRSEAERTQVLEAWRQRAAATLGRQVEWDDDGAPVSGLAEGIDRTGALLIRTASGHRRVTAGEVRWT